MKKLMGMLAMAAVMTAPAWAGEIYSLRIDGDGAAFVHRNDGTATGGGGYEIARIRPRDPGDRLWSQRLKEIDRRLDLQMERIRAGSRHGGLTQREAGRLEADHHRIRSYFHSAVGDGRLSQREWHNLTVMLDQQNEAIYGMAHNRRHAKKDAPFASPEKRWKFDRRLIE